jgi:hypothetical protein
MTEQGRTDLRQRLVAMRNDLLEQLVVQIDAGALRLLSDISAALMALNVVPTGEK